MRISDWSSDVCSSDLGGSNSDFDHKSGTIGHRTGRDTRRLRRERPHSYRVFTLNHREIRITVSLQRLAFISMNPMRLGDGVLNIAIKPCGFPACIVIVHKVKHEVMYRNSSGGGKGVAISV